MIDSEHYLLVYQIAELLEKKLDCKIKDHGMWRVQCLIHDTLEDEKEFEKKRQISLDK
tara:strand:+ start:298 stop:471 length:174 start_codon:yes stop_codon:yes gene_type:complete